MPFCANCGSRVEAGSPSCAGCGKALGNGKCIATGEHVCMTEPLEFTIRGDSHQAVRIRLKPGQEILAETANLLYKFPDVSQEDRGNGLVRYSAPNPSEVGFAGARAGRIQAVELKAGQHLLAEHEGILCLQSSVRLAGPAGLEGPALERMAGPGTVFLHAEGEFVEFNLNFGQPIQVDADRIVAMDASVVCSAEPGQRLATLTGPGLVLMQSIPRAAHATATENELTPVPVGAGSES